MTIDTKFYKQVLVIIEKRTTGHKKNGHSSIGKLHHHDFFSGGILTNCYCVVQFFFFNEGGWNKFIELEKGIRTSLWC